jgi:predicted nuclease of predicted toxin-antitoxin system
MRLLCDHNVARKYVQAFEQSDNITVTTVAEELSPEATDETIVRFAKRNRLVVFTTDDDFFEHADVCGVLVYSQITDPSPGDVLDAVTAIDDAYESQNKVIETIPGNWL